MEIEVPTTKSRSRLGAAQLCLQVAQVCVSFTVVLFGLAVGGVGWWTIDGQKRFVIISDGDPQLTRLPLSIIVAGIVVALLGVIGVIGGLFTRTITGRILIGVYAFVLGLLVINEIGAGVSAVYFRDEVRSVFVDSAQRSLMKYGDPNATAVTERWNKFQEKHECCGAKNFESYRQVFKNNTVPASCCVIGLDPSDCEAARLNATAGDSNKLNLGGCPDKVIDKLKEYDLTAAIVVMVIGVAQLSGVILACVVAYVSSKAEEKRSYSYNRLSQEQT